MGRGSADDEALELPAQLALARQHPARAGRPVVTINTELVPHPPGLPEDLVPLSIKWPGHPVAHFNDTLYEDAGATDAWVVMGNALFVKLNELADLEACPCRTNAFAQAQGARCAHVETARALQDIGWERWLLRPDELPQYARQEGSGWMQELVYTEGVASMPEKRVLLPQHEVVVFRAGNLTQVTVLRPAGSVWEADVDLDAGSCSRCFPEGVRGPLQCYHQSVAERIPAGSIYSYWLSLLASGVQAVLNGDGVVELYDDTFGDAGGVSSFGLFFFTTNDGRLQMNVVLDSTRRSVFDPVSIRGSFAPESDRACAFGCSGDSCPERELVERLLELRATLQRRKEARQLNG